MGIYYSDLWFSDIDETITTLPEIRDLSGNTIMVTGSTGLICSAIVDVLIRWNITHNEKITILAAGRDERRLKKRFEPFCNEEWFVYTPYDATSTNNRFAFECDYIIHGASNASPGKIVNEPVETMMSNVIGIKYLLDFAKRSNVKRVLYISSSEVYGEKKGNQPYKSNEYGYIDLLNSRNSYSIGKRAAENLCISYSKEYDVNTVIVRPGHIYGPTALETDNRVSSEWAFDVAYGKDIIMKSDGLQVRSYCYCLDCASAILKVLLKGENNQAYNISNSESIITIREMGNILANVGGVQLKMQLPSERERMSFNPMSNSSLDASELETIGWKGLFDAKRGFAHTVKILKEINGLL